MVNPIREKKYSTPTRKKKKKQAPLKPATVVLHKKHGAGVILKRFNAKKKLVAKNPNKDWCHYLVRFINRPAPLVVARCKIKVFDSAGHPPARAKAWKPKAEWLTRFEEPRGPIKQDL